MNLKNHDLANDLKKKILNSLYAGLLLGFISMLAVGFLALSVWYRHIGWAGNPSIPLYQPVLLLLPLQTSMEHLDLLGVAPAVAMKSVVYGAVVFCGTLVRDALLAKKEPRMKGARQ